MTQRPNIPPDFPYSQVRSCVTGTAPKLALRKGEDGIYVEESLAETVEERYAVCTDLVDQLTAYFHRKMAAQPVDPQTLLVQIHAELETKKWVDPIELDWIVKQVALEWGVSAPMTARDLAMSLQRALSAGPPVYVETRVDAALNRLSRRS